MMPMISFLFTFLFFNQKIPFQKTAGKMHNCFRFLLPGILLPGAKQLKSQAGQIIFQIWEFIL